MTFIILSIFDLDFTNIRIHTMYYNIPSISIHSKLSANTINSK